MARPFLKWAGGKAQLLPELLKRVPAKFGTYHEPFLGGGALFFALHPLRACLSDANADLVRTYQTVRDHVGELIECLSAFVAKHCEQQYYDVRADHNSGEGGDVDCAARMIYLNKTCFNGLYRVNASGGFNVAVGKFKSPPTICDDENLRACSEALKGCEIVCSDFRPILRGVSVSGDFVYLDPPYVPVSTTANFTAYTKAGFGPEDQNCLAALAGAAKARGIRVLVSNAGDEATAAMYRSAGLMTEMVTARRNINCSAGARGPVGEVLAT